MVSAIDAPVHLSDSLGLKPPPAPVPVLSIEDLQSECRSPASSTITDLYAPGEVLVKFDIALKTGDVTRLVESFSLSWEGSFFLSYSSGNWGKIFVPTGSEPAWIKKFESLCYVLYAEPNFSVSITGSGGGGIGIL